MKVLLFSLEFYIDRYVWIYEYWFLCKTVKMLTDPNICSVKALLISNLMFTNEHLNEVGA
jgi:hypothetical protein